MIQHLSPSYPNTTKLEAAGGSDFIALVTKWSWIALILSSAYQCLFHMATVNLVAIFCVAIGWAMVARIFLRREMLEDFPLSSFLILAFAATQFYLPLLFTTLEGKSLVYNMEVPELVFLHSMAGLVVVLLAHALYRFLVKMQKKRNFPILAKAGFFTPPKDIQLWLLGILGAGATYYIFFNNPDVGRIAGEGTPFDKLIQGLIPFLYAPFFIPVGKLYGKQTKSSPLLVPLLLVYTIAVFALSIGRNSRGAFMLGFTSVAFAYGLGLLMGIFETRVFTIKNGIFAGALFWLLTGPMADLGTAMVIVRGDHEISASALIDLTLRAYGDKEAIKARRLEDNLVDTDSDWDERYLDNIFTARFANIKFNDMSLVCAAKIGEQDEDMINFSRDYFFSAFPEPMLKAFNIDVDKAEIGAMSFGDYLYLVSGGRGFTEGFRTGHFAGTGMATFGWWYLLLLGIGMVPIYLLFDLFYTKSKSPKDGSTVFQFSFCGLLALTTIWGFLPNETVVSLATFLVRGWIQLALLYFVFFQFTGLMIKAFTTRFKWGG